MSLRHLLRPESGSVVVGRRERPDAKTRWKVRGFAGAFVVLAAILIGTPTLNASSDKSKRADDLQAPIVGIARVQDGDTVRIGKHWIRLFGIDAPEQKQGCRDRHGVAYACGKRAKRALVSLIDNQSLRCWVNDIDRYQRAVAVCYLSDSSSSTRSSSGRADNASGESINARMVESGWALAYRHYSHDFVLAEERARQAGRGVWQGEFEKPWVWRHARAAAAKRAAEAQRGATLPDSGQCRIKGNINSRGDRIYHLPGQSSYAQTRISPEKGERFFCTESEARAAGWRPSESRD
jgi:endonuclease YncB( thermonuclease family)